MCLFFCIYQSAGTGRPWFRKFATTDYPLTSNAKISLQQQQRLMARQQQTTASPASSSSSSMPGTRAETESNGQDKGGDTSSCSANSEPATASAAIDSSAQQDGTCAATGSASAGDDQSVIAMRSVQLRYRSSCSEVDSMDYLPKFVAWVASSCLMTLARTSYINRLNLMVADCSLSRHFSLVPMRTGFRLKSSSLTTKSSMSDTCLSQDVSSSSVPTLSTPLATEGTDNSTTLEADTGHSKAVNVVPTELQSTDNENISDPTRSNEALKPAANPSLTHPERSASQNSYFSSYHDAEQFKPLISRLQVCFEPADLDRDIEQAELLADLPAPLLEDGRRLYTLVDAAGQLGIDERDLQVSFSYYNTVPVCLSVSTPL